MAAQPDLQVWTPRRGKECAHPLKATQASSVGPSPCSRGVYQLRAGVDFECLSAYTNCRLIALDKRPGVRPIVVGEVCRRIVGKAILEVVKADVRRATGTTQLCAGQEGGCEAAVHATRLMFSDEDCEGVLLIDATNAFNSLNRRVALHNTALLCPSLFTVLSNS